MRARLWLLLVASALALAVPAPTQAADQQTIAARQRFFGSANVDPATGAVRSDRVILSWFSVTNFAAAIGGHVVLLDAWVARGYHSGYVPTSPEELANLRPEAIFIGHGHFDHAQHAHRIALASGAPIVGTPEHCSDIRARAGDAPIRCVEASPQEAAPGSKRELHILGGVGLTALRQVHSPSPARGITDLDDRRTSCPPPPNFEATLGYPPLPGDVIENLQGAAELAGSEGGVMAYQFRVGSLSLTWPDSTPNLKDAPAVAAGLRRLPSTDVLLGALASFGRGTSCLRDVGRYVDVVRPRLFVPTHHDNWDPTESNGSYYEPFLRQELSLLPAARRPCLRFIADPRDYVRPDALTFDVAAPDVCRPGERVPAPRCLARRAPIGPRNIGRIRLGFSRQRLLRVPVAPLRRTRGYYRYCVKGSGRRLTAVLSRRGRVRLVVTRARGHRIRRVGPGTRSSRLVRSFPRRRHLGDGVVRAGPRSRRIFGTRRGRVRYVAVADRRVLRDRARLRIFLRRARQ